MSDNAEKQAVERVKVVISDDRLQAHVQLVGTSTPSWRPPNAAEVLAVLQAARIKVTDAVRAHVEALVAECNQAVASREQEGGDLKLPDAFLVAEGTPPVNAEDGRFEWAEALSAGKKSADDQERVDYFAVNAVLSVPAGTEIGKVIPPKESVAGEDVFGDPKPPGKQQGMAVKLGEGLTLASDGTTKVVTTADGRVVEEHGEVRLYETLELSGDVDFSTGSVDAVIDVHVRGVVKAGFTLRTSRSLTVDKLIEAAKVDVGENVSVRGGVFGNDGQGRIRAGGDIAAAFFNEVRVEAGGDIRFNKEILNSHVRARGRVVSERGTIIGGAVHGREGLETSVLGSDADVQTHVSVGTDVNSLRRARQMERQVKEYEKSADHIRQTIQPLMANLKRLTSEQRERVTELMSKADEIELQQLDTEQECKQLLAEAAPSSPATVVVHNMAHPGTRMIIEAREVVLQRPLNGPVRIELRKVKNTTEVAAVNLNTASVTVLPAVDVDLDIPPEDETQEPAAEQEPHESTADNQ